MVQAGSNYVKKKLEVKNLVGLSLFKINILHTLRNRSDGAEVSSVVFSSDRIHHSTGNRSDGVAFNSVVFASDKNSYTNRKQIR